MENGSKERSSFLEACGCHMVKMRSQRISRPERVLMRLFRLEIFTGNLLQNHLRISALSHETYDNYHRVFKRGLQCPFLQSSAFLIYFTHAASLISISPLHSHKTLNGFVFLCEFMHIIAVLNLGPPQDSGSTL